MNEKKKRRKKKLTKCASGSWYHPRVGARSLYPKIKMFELHGRCASSGSFMDFMALHFIYCRIRGSEWKNQKALFGQSWVDILYNASSVILVQSHDRCSASVQTVRKAAAIVWYTQLFRICKGWKQHHGSRGTEDWLNPSS